MNGMLKGPGGFAFEEPEVVDLAPERAARTEFFGTERYELGDLLGVGAMGVVYQAFDRELNTLVALKCLPGASAQAALRFKREFRSVRDINHENLVALGELVSADDQLFFTMEFVDGTDIVSYCQQLSFDSRRRPHCRARAEDPTLDAETAGLAGSHERRASAAMADEARLRLAFAGLTRGLMALHAAHKVHRDIKPSNVLVTNQGRVVVLDFGVVLDSTPEPSEVESRLVGTIAYMSPEQAARGAIGFESDWYSVGVVLFEALTQRLPFEGTSSEVLQHKQALRPPRVRDFAATVSAELDELCDRMLETRPSDRPLGPQILSVLEGPAPAFTATTQGSQRSLFVGRSQELARLNQALASARAGHATLVHVEGQSGSGKTALLRDFSLRAKSVPGTLVLHARCSEREYVPFRAIDGAVDALAEYAVRSNAAQLREVLDSQLPHLARAFPVFTRIGTNSPADEVADPYLSRLNLFRALCALLTALREETMVVLMLDDMQWADADSLALLSAVLRPPHAPAILVLAASRPHWPGRSLLRALGGETVALDNLPLSDAITLARQLVLRTRPEEPHIEQLAERIACEAAGHPLFIDELVRQNLEAVGLSAADVTLDSVLWARVEALAPQARTFVHLVAVARGSLSLRVLTRAARQTLAEVSTLSTLILLRNEHLLELDGTGATSQARAYHDRINAATLLHLPSERRAELHAALAQALELEPERDPEQLAVHWREAGDSEAAAGYALAAAGRAAAGLAFEQAASLYQMALDSWPSHPDAHQIQVLMADALASAGLGPRAAQAYLKASEVSDEAWRIELQRYAADQLFRAGHIDAAEPLIQRVLRYMGISIPESIPWVIIALLLSRAQLAFSRVATVEPSDGPVEASKLAALDACWSAAVGLSMVSNLRGACMQSRHMLLALKLRQRLPLIRALATEASYLAVRGQRARAASERLLGRAEVLARDFDSEYAHGFITLSRSICSFLVGDWSKSRTLASAAERFFKTRPEGAMWELASARTFGLWSHFYLGDFAKLAERVSDFIQEAETRGDRYAATLHRTGLVTMVWLASDDPQFARRQVMAAETGWSRTIFDFQRYLNTLGHCLIDHYVGAPELAHRRMAEIWPRLRASQYLRIQNLRFEALYLRGVFAIGAATNGDAGPLLREAEQCAQRIMREGVAWSKALGNLLSGGVCAARGQTEEAVRHWQLAEQEASGHDMTLFAAAAAHRLELAGKALGANRDPARYAALRAIREPERVCLMFAPGKRVQAQRSYPGLGLRGRGTS